MVQQRQLAGVRTGGQFMGTTHAESGITLTLDNRTAGSSGFGEPEPFGYDAELLRKGSPLYPRTGPSCLSPQASAGLNFDLDEIRRDYSMSDWDQLRALDMADKLNQFGARYENDDVYFLHGSAYDGKPVPQEFANFRYEIETEHEMFTEAGEFEDWAPEPPIAGIQRGLIGRFLNR